MSSHGHAIDHHGDDHDAAKDKYYIKIAIILTIITIIEVAIYYVSALRGVLIPALVLLSTAKFVLVVGVFMHLKYENKLLTWIFVAGLFISVTVMIAMISVFHAGHYYAPVLLPPS
ncbi:MAG: cytochrome C oxidase subunit IV family protein [Chloroflexota bacterium]